MTASNPPWNYADHPISPSAWYASGVPFPTNVWWQNMVLEDGDLINAVNPYIVKTLSDGLHVCLPTISYGYEIFQYLFAFPILAHLHFFGLTWWHGGMVALQMQTFVLQIFTIFVVGRGTWTTHVQTRIPNSVIGISNKFSIELLSVWVGLIKLGNH